MSLTYGSLFSGVGGFDLGFDAEGYDCLWQVEWDPHCQETLAYHWPSVPKWHDVCDVSGAELLAANGGRPCDVITFGSPCQDLSVAGRRRGLEGERSGLFFEALRIIEEMRNGTNGNVPRVAVWENVAGALFSNRGADFGRVLDEMAELGALVIDWAVLDAQWFGVPQRRRRVFVIAVFDPAVAKRCTESLLPVIPRRLWDPEARKQQRQSPTTDVGTGTPSGCGSEIGTGCLNQPMILEPIGFDSHASGSFKVHADGQSPPVRLGSALNIPSPPAVAQPIIENDPVGTLQAQHHEGCDAEEARDGMLVPYPDCAVRRLTPLECERLMGWPDDHTRWRADGKENSDTNRYKMCGNGVVAPVSAWIARRLREVLSEQ